MSNVTLRPTSAPSLPRMSGQGVGQVLFVGVAVAVVFLLLWRSRTWWQDALLARLAAWKLGPWPVRPGEVRVEQLPVHLPPVIEDVQRDLVALGDVRRRHPGKHRLADDRELLREAPAVAQAARAGIGHFQSNYSG